MEVVYAKRLTTQIEDIVINDPAIIDHIKLNEDEWRQLEQETGRAFYSGDAYYFNFYRNICDDKGNVKVKSIPIRKMVKVVKNFINCPRTPVYRPGSLVNVGTYEYPS